MRQEKREKLVHPFGPIYAPDSKILILGSFPSRLSRKNAFYYGNPLNRFWPMLATIYKEKILPDSASRIAFIQRHGLAIFDVIQSCSIVASADSSIRDVIPFNPKDIMAPIRLVLLNGQKAGSLYKKYLSSLNSLPYVVLPSTSPANASCSLSDLVRYYSPYLLTNSGKNAIK